MDYTAKHDEPLISVIIPAFNPIEKYFEEAINSIFAQTYKNWEIIIVNDGSDEKRSLFLNNFIKNLNNGKFTLINNENNKGVSAAKNKGIESAKGEIITFLDADDIHLPWYYEDLIKNFLNNPDSLIFATPEIYLYDLPKYKKIFCLKHFSSIFHQSLEISRFHRALLDKDIEMIKQIEKLIRTRQLLICTPRLATKKEVFKSIKFDENLKTDEDCDLCLQILNNEYLLQRTIISEKSSYLYRLHPSSERLTQKMDFLFPSKASVLQKYNNGNNSYVHRLLKVWNLPEEWKFANPITKHITNGYIKDYIKNSILKVKGWKNKVSSIKFLFRIFLKYKLLNNRTGMRYIYLRNALFNKSYIDKTKDIRNWFIEQKEKNNNGIYLSKMLKNICN